MGYGVKTPEVIKPKHRHLVKILLNVIFEGGGID